MNMMKKVLLNRLKQKMSLKKNLNLWNLTWLDWKDTQMRSWSFMHLMVKMVTFWYRDQQMRRLGFGIWKRRLFHKLLKWNGHMIMFLLDIRQLQKITYLFSRMDRLIEHTLVCLEKILTILCPVCLQKSNIFL